MMALSGCRDDVRRTYAAEVDEPAYRQGQALLKSGRRQEALAAFLNVIERRADAPESHLEAGLLYLQHINDPLAAIFHFKKYLSLRPNSPQSALVKQRIDFAIREFAKTLPAQPLPAQFERIDLLAKVDRLQRDNDELRQQLADLKAGRFETTGLATGPAATAAESRFDLKTEGLPTVRTRPAPPVSPPRGVGPPSGSAQPSSGPVASTSVRARTHIVQQGDTLYKLAQQYYQDRARWRDIFAANRDVMRTETDLKIGMTIRIP